MKKIFSLLAALSLSSAISQEVQLVHSLSKKEAPAHLFDPSSPYRILQDALWKKQISLRCIEKDNSPLYFSEKRKNSLPIKLQEYFTGKSSSIVFSENPNDYLVFWNIPQDLSLKTLQKVPSDRMILFTFDPFTETPKELPSIFSKIYTWNDDLVDDKKYFKFYIPSLQSMKEPTLSFEEKRLCTHFLTTHKEVGTTSQSTLSWFSSKNFQTLPRSTKQDLDQYRFCVCIEPVCDLPGYISEKIFTAFESGCIPIYLGASNIERYIPKSCFIDPKDFNSPEELLLYLETMSHEDHLIMQENIQTFLASKEAKVFSMEHFSKIFQESIE